MKPVYSKCGNMCSSCPWGVWIRRNQSPEEWKSFAEDVKKYAGYSPTKNPCHGCQTPTENLSKDVGFHNFLRGCSARKCAFHNDFRNCAYCSRYPCDKIKSLNVTINREAAEQRIGEPIPEDKYLAFVRIFEGMKNLDKVPEVGALIIIGFAKPEGGTGGYARYIAVCPPDWKYGKSIEELPGSPLPKQPYPNKRDENGVLKPTP